MHLACERINAGRAVQTLPGEADYRTPEWASTWPSSTGLAIKSVRLLHFSGLYFPVDHITILGVL